MKIWISILFTWVVLGCQQKNIPSNFIELEGQIGDRQKSKLSDIADSISYIFLETDSNVLLPNISTIVYLDSLDIFIRGGNYVYRFSREGRFVNRLGAVGLGPEEYPNLKDVSVDVFNRRLLLLTQSSYIYTYGYEGKLINKLKLGGEIGAMTSLDDGTFVCEVRSYSDQDYMSSLVQFDQDGKIMRQVEMGNDNIGFNRSLQTVSIMYNINEGVGFKSLYNDTLYIYDGQRLSLHKTLHLGKFSPSRDLIENVEKKVELLSNYVQIIDIVESDQYLFLLVIMNKGLNGIVVDKLNNRVIYNQEIESPKIGGGIVNDFHDNSRFWPMLSTGY